MARDDWDTILPAYSRCVRITRQSSVSSVQCSVDEALFVEDAERDLYAALQTAESAMSLSAPHYPGGTMSPLAAFLTAFVPMIPAIDKFFEDVLVMVDDETVRNNRLALLQRIAPLSAGIVDLSRLEGF